MAHGDITRMEWRVLIQRPGGFGSWVEWAATKGRVDQLRELYPEAKGFTVLSVTWAQRVLDY